MINTMPDDPAERSGGTMQTDTNTKRGRLYWGPGPLPHGAEFVGTVRRAPGDEGALLRMTATGRMMQGNAGALRSLPPEAKQG